VKFKSEPEEALNPPPLERECVRLKKIPFTNRWTGCEQWTPPPDSVALQFSIAVSVKTIPVPSVVKIPLPSFFAMQLTIYDIFTVHEVAFAMYNPAPLPSDWQWSAYKLVIYRSEPLLIYAPPPPFGAVDEKSEQ
jgi:hypothetical protein